MRWKPGMIFVVVLLATACGTIAPLSDSERASLADPPRKIAESVAALQPGAVAYIEDSEREIMRRGRPLTADQTLIARAVGVVHPEQVRVLATVDGPQSPALQPWLRQLLPFVQAAPSASRGLH